MKMTQEDLDELCEALESGRFPQGTHRLERVGSFCCLGLLSKLQADKGHVYRIPDEDPSMDVWYFDKSGEVSSVSGTGSSSCLTPGLMTRFSCSSVGFSIPYEELPLEIQGMGKFVVERRYSSTGYSLADLNDFGVPFPLISKLIRKHVEIVKEY